MHAQIQFKKVSQLIAARGMGVALQMLMQFAVARIAGAAGLGFMQLCQTWVCVLGEAAAMGLPTEMLKRTARFRERYFLRFQLGQSILRITQIWMLSVMAVLLFCLMLGQHHHLVLLMALSLAIYAFSITRVAVEMLKSLDKPGVAIQIENAIMPLIVLLAAVAISLDWFGVLQLKKADVLVYAFVLGLMITACTALCCCHLEIMRLPEGTSEFGQTLIGSKTLYFCGSAVLAFAFLNLPFFLMPYYVGMQELGLYGLAFKLINPITTLLIMLAAIYGPRFACYAHDCNQLAQLLRQSQKYSLLIYAPFWLLLLIFAEPVLGLFGAEFIDARPYLLIIGAAQLVNAATGLSSNLLNMVGQGDKEFLGAVFAMLFGLAACIFAASRYGALGIATGFALALALKNIWSYAVAIWYLQRHNSGSIHSQTTLSLGDTP